MRQPYTCYYAYDVDTERLIKRLVDHIKYVKDCGLKTTFMGWDVTRASLDYVKKVYTAVVEQAEPEAVVYTDSFGVASPLAIYKAISELKKELGVPVSSTCIMSSAWPWVQCWPQSTPA